MMIYDEFIEKFRTLQHLVILTGAGVSAESGIPTFRDALTGLWAKHDPYKLACAEGFVADPALVWGWYEWRRKKVLRASPNPAHITIAQLAQRIPKLTLITQNVDDLHERAGSQNVIHLHGSMHNPRCFKCSQPYIYPDEIDDDFDDSIPEQRIPPPRCNQCGDVIRPGVVWFKEQLPALDFNLAEVACTEGDLLLVIGTSGMVYPAANLPHLAHQAGIPVVEINPNIDSFNSISDFHISGKAGKILPLLYQAAFEDLAN